MSRAWETPDGFIPAGETAVISETAYVEFMRLSNVTGGDVFVTVKNNQALCNGALCDIVPTMRLDPNSVTVVPLSRSKFTGGIRWQASAANSVVGYMKGNLQ